MAHSQPVSKGILGIRMVQVKTTYNPKRTGQGMESNPPAIFQTTPT